MRALLSAAGAVLGLWPAMSLAAPPHPHVLLVVVDDMGWADVGYHRVESRSPTPEVQTPTIDDLVASGVELNRHYVHMTCTPSRASLQTGRLPVHMITKLCGPCDAQGAIPRNVTGIARKLKSAGYATHQVGKWDVGMVTPHHTPQGRGYDSSLNYFGHGNWMWTETEWQGSFDHRGALPAQGDPAVDFWDTDRPASHLNGTGYEELLFRDRMRSILEQHDKDTPLFLNYNSKIAHYPLQAPLEYQRRFAHIANDNRRMYHAMVNFLDDQLKNLTGMFKEMGLWDDTLMIFTSDNGGYVKNDLGGCNTTSGTDGAEDTDWGHGTTCFNGEAGANNWPLRGGKYAMFEGGIRVNAFVSGGYLPTSARGSKLEGIVHVADWYGTLCALAGVDPRDAWAEASGLPGVDSVNVWPMISGQNLTSPRTEFLVNENLLVSGEWKYVAGGTRMIESARGGVHYPNASRDFIDAHSSTCPESGCLFDVASDPSEFHEVSAQHPEVVKMLKGRMEEWRKTIWEVNHHVDPACAEAARNRYGGFYGPWKEVPSLSQK